MAKYNFILSDDKIQKVFDRLQPLNADFISFGDFLFGSCIGGSHWDRYLGMMTAMTQVSVPATTTSPDPIRKLTPLSFRAPIPPLVMSSALGRDDKVEE